VTRPGTPTGLFAQINAVYDQVEDLQYASGRSSLPLVKRGRSSWKCKLMEVVGGAVTRQHTSSRTTGCKAMTLFSTLDLIALAWFILAWAGYAVLVELTPQSKVSLNALMDRYREVWMRRMLAREMRMVDMQIMAALQNGTAFFASTSLIAIGGALTLLRSTEDVLTVIATLPFGIQATRGQWELKTIGVAVIFVYAFFKFAWSYRLFNYVAIMLGATPLAQEQDTPEAQAHALRTARLFETAGRHFNRGQRAFFFALGYLGWFVSAWVLMATTRRRGGRDLAAPVRLRLASRDRRGLTCNPSPPALTAGSHPQPFDRSRRERPGSGTAHRCVRPAGTSADRPTRAPPCRSAASPRPLSGTGA